MISPLRMGCYCVNILLMPKPITKLSLPNGLLVLLKEIHTVPLISHWLWYRVGSRNEKPGKTGLSHWVEHMQFKGTTKHPVNETDKAISRVGGIWNAFTYLDWTTYFETMPADTIELALEIEADRMINAAFDTKEVESERTVILSEMQGNENQPSFKLGRAIQSTAFRKHPYHHVVIGEEEDLLSITRDELYDHYKTYYNPNNAVLVLAGDFNTDEMLETIKRFYNPIQPGAEPPKLLAAEPPLNGEERVVLEGPGEATYVRLAYRVPEGKNPDFMLLNVLDSLLTGASSMNVFGGGISNRTSRLYVSLVEKEMAVNVSGGLQATIDPFLYTISVINHPEHTCDEVIAAIDREIVYFQENLPTQAELNRAVKQARALFAYGTESITNQAFWMGFSEMFDSYDWFTTYLDRLSAVTPQDVQNVAQKYLRPDNRVVGIYKPTDSHK